MIASVGYLYLALYLVSALVVYCIPSYIAYEREDPHLTSVLVVNLALGWTIIGWVVALLMAFNNSRDADTPQ